VYNSRMTNGYFFAFVEVPRWGPTQLRQARRAGIVPTFEKDDKPVSGPMEVSLRFDAPTAIEARARLREVFGASAQVSRVVWMHLPRNTDGLTAS
jgi:hypothetical protein